MCTSFDGNDQIRIFGPSKLYKVLVLLCERSFVDSCFMMAKGVFDELFQALASGFCG